MFLQATDQDVPGGCGRDGERTSRLMVIGSAALRCAAQLSEADGWHIGNVTV